VLVTASLYFAQKVLIPLALAILLAFILAPLVDLLQRKSSWRIPSVLLVVVLALLLMSGVGLGLVLQMKRLAGDLPLYKDNIAHKIAGLRDVGQGRMLQDLQGMFKEITEAAPKGRRGPEGIAPEPPVVRLESSSVPIYEQAAGQAVEFLASAGLVVVLVTFMLIRKEDLRNRLVRLVAHGRLIITTRAFEEGARRLSRFLFMQFTINAGFGLVLGISLWAIGLPYPLLWGILAASLRFVPYVGSLITTVLILVFSAAVFPAWTQSLVILGLLLLLEVSTANVVEPLLFGHSTGVSPIALLAAAAFWTWLWGPIGLVLSTPLTACLVVLGRYVPHLEFLGVLLGDEPALDPEVNYYQRLLARDQDEASELVEEFLQAQGKEKVYDSILSPALVLAKRDRESGALAPDDEQFIIQGTRDIVEDLVSVHEEESPGTDGSAAPEPSTSTRPKVVVFGCAARDDADEVDLHMFRQLLEPTGCQVDILSAKTLTAEVVARVRDERPAVVCIAALPPGGLAQTRYLCKRLRAQFRDLKIIVGRWGATENIERTRERLKSVGANDVCTTLVEARDHVIPWVQIHSHIENHVVA
jgi:predicted PurR-regulated permease PerM/CheY-like chemotaxis protein